MAKYEAHLTINIEHSQTVKFIVAEGMVPGWKFSAIDGEALMADKPYCYLTAYDPDGAMLLTRASEVTQVLAFHRIEVLRTKVERIVYDTKTGVDELRVDR